jgi:hypothetical protein
MNLDAFLYNARMRLLLWGAGNDAAIRFVRVLAEDETLREVNAYE